MLKFIFGLLLFSNSVFAAGLIPGVVSSLAIGGETFIDQTNLIVLECGTSSAFGTCRKSGASAGYAVTAAKTLTIRAMSVENTSTGNNFSCFQTDTDVGIASASNGTNPISFQTGTSTALNGFLAIGSGIANYNPFFPVAATKFITCNANANIHYRMYGYEQ